MAEKKLPKGITLRKDGRYYWRFVFDGEQYAGYTRTLSEAEKQLGDTKYEVTHGTFLKPDKTTCDEWFNVWITSYQVKLKDSTREHHKAFYYRYFSPTFGKVRMQILKPTKIQMWLNEFAKDHGNATINILFAMLKKMFDCATAIHLIKENPFNDAVTIPQGIERSYKREVLTRQETTLFFSYAENTCYYNLLRFLSLTGMRVGEALALSWSDVNFDEKTIHIKHTLTYTKEKGYFLGTTKTKKGTRTIKVSDKVISILNKQKLEQAKQKIRKGAEWVADEGLNELVFTSETGKPICGRNVDCSIRRIVKHMQKDGVSIKPFGVHQLRHAFATRCIEEGMPTKVLSEHLGHKDIRTTMNEYVGVVENDADMWVNKVSSAL